ncbi:MAG: fumarate hydratase, partial [Syntrophorhabdus sp.]
MKEVHVDEIVSVIEKLFIDANYNLSQNVLDTIKKSIDKEESSVGKEVLRELIKNANLARDEHIPICQDTGLAVTFMEVGQDVHIIGGSLNDAINEGVRRGYAKGYLRKSACH